MGLGEIDDREVIKLPDLGCWEGIIWRDGDYVPKSAILKCKCGKTGWHTKNIGYIGARTIYNFAGGCEWMKEQMTCVSECDCPGSHLAVDEELMLHVKDCGACRKYGL